MVQDRYKRYFGISMRGWVLNLLMFGSLLFWMVVFNYATANQIVLKNNQWWQGGVPARIATDTSLWTLTDGLLLAEDKGIVWDGWYFDSETNSYGALALTDPMIPGKAYWIVQLTGSDITINLPASEPAVDDCTEVVIRTDLDNNRFAMVAYTEPVEQLAENTRVFNTTTCNVGCGLVLSELISVVGNTILRWNGDTESYYAINSSTSIKPTEGGWIKVFGTPEPTDPPTIGGSTTFPVLKWPALDPSI